MPELVCPYCSSRRCQKDYELRWKDERFAEYAVASCQDCAVGFVLPLPTESELTELYNSIQYHDTDRGAGNFWDFDDSQVAARIKKDAYYAADFQPHLPDHGHVLDVGAGWGTMLKSFSNNGFQTTGIELSGTACEFARQKLKLNVFNLPIEQLNKLPDEKYDLITMRHVLEHFYHPKNVLEELRQRMKPNGKIIITVPDYGSYDRKAFGADWPGFGPYHLWYFTRPSLQRLMNDCGFDVIKFHTFMSERIFGGKSKLQQISRKIANRLGGRHWFSGRAIGLIAKLKD